jgi:hypothetical protein
MLPPFQNFLLAAKKTIFGSSFCQGYFSLVQTSLTQAKGSIR